MGKHKLFSGVTLCLGLILFDTNILGQTDEQLDPRLLGVLQHWMIYGVLVNLKPWMDQLHCM